MHFISHYIYICCKSYSYFVRIVSQSMLFPLFLTTDSPRSTSIAMFPAGELSEGGSVTLTCSSDAAPPVESFAWFKGKQRGMLVGCKL